jgi:hypothetical protein
MPPTGGLLGTTQARFVRAQLIRAYQSGGRHYIDAHMASGAGGWTGIPVMEFGGGSGRFLFVPMAGDQGDDKPAFAPAEQSDPTDIDSAQVWLFFDGASNFPVCLGAVQHSKRGLVDDTPETSVGNDRDADASYKDIFAENGGSWMALDSRGVVAFSLADGKQVSFQLAGAGVLRVSRDGDATERLLLANATKGYFSGTEDHLDAQESRIAALESAVNSLVAFLAPGVAVSGGLTAPYLVPYAAPSGVNRPTADDTLVAAAIHVSDDDEAP